uniref:Dynein light chain n=1 Tax=Fibrocapsa japonica TaxID=94617 RepID=A0A7S2XX11_9STRA|mmetsp:Transcript_17044/g.24912  ORF Transcript_17044/g.24912 Transcript_17044/m.24912 type:complete len:119 (+) Transcript_17044:189-545(+)|eukprot:CAMPEP_0113948040 /NCGR_PEP_ID=MMETSP1339-20121228/68150_1 /TAXON_ID=94617 /ORGANISM="Fibrocapsa japonica" /LENGTH=118 /DNA_ID=CAMNT_0000954903 /DNA_START=121 /DNA_END=477 /DNA_ORIENTATION=- /assembly_acc=CAM_ASM_000762
MDDLQSSEELAFIPEQVEPLLYQAIDQVLKTEVYDQSKVPQWIDTICETCVAELTALKKPFKYVVNCLIMQKNGAGLNMGQAAHWDLGNDNMASAKWPPREQQSSRMVCVVTAFGFQF